MAQGNNVTVPRSFLDDTVRLVELASYTIKRAGEENNVHKAAQQKAAQLRGPLLEDLLRSGLVAPGAKQAAAAMLGSHAETLNLLKAAADMIVELSRQQAAKTAGDLGQGVDDPRTPALGGPTGAPGDRESDSILREILHQPG